VALIGATVAKQLFGAADPLDQSIRIKRVPFTIIGVLETKGQSMMGTDQDDLILVPIKTARSRVLGTASAARNRSVSTIWVKAADSVDTKVVEEQVCGLVPGCQRSSAARFDELELAKLGERGIERRGNRRELEHGGEGETVGRRDSTDGSSTSALKFGSDEPLSIIREGSGYWKYIPTDDGVRFLTWYDYRTRFGAVGAYVDRLIFRPLIGWATAWSFDRLRLWLEQGVAPEQAIRQWVARDWPRIKKTPGAARPSSASWTSRASH